MRADTVQLRGHNYKLYKDRSLKLCRMCFFSQRVVNCWNLLPQQVVDAPSLESFKTRLDKFMDSISNVLGNKANCLLSPSSLMMLLLMMMVIYFRFIYLFYFMVN